MRETGRVIKYHCRDAEREAFLLSSLDLYSASERRGIKFRNEKLNVNRRPINRRLSETVGRVSAKLRYQRE